ncbi:MULTISPECIES: DUF3000 domain-containing protein [Pseudoclavibacter]|uniref:DUF3000 domain-containing protein n=1 Tax=Pseudoclavibacter TaxID=255204 RepID=UPI000CE832EF|nr:MULTISPECIES: DUF3000 domain-containing protein [Pseudoclavibacter]PPF47291.1 DUF3000 domain-containing protein [Pseudoclavibacter sp. AY1F1]
MVVPLHRSAPEFEAAVEAVRAAEFRSALTVSEIRPPANLAPESLALSGDVRPTAHASDSELGTGRFILLHDESEPEAWRGAFRVVCFAQAPLEPEIGVDPFLAPVAWSWLMDALESRGAAFEHPSGTATTINGRGFGELEDQGEGAQIELRASWTPRETDLAAHAEAWGELLCLLAGMPPESEADDGVEVLRHLRKAKDGA